MDSQKLIELGERLAKAFNSSDWGAYSAAMTNDTLYESPRAQARGPEQILEFVKGVKVAYPDMKATATNAPLPSSSPKAWRGGAPSGWSAKDQPAPPRR